MKTNEVDPEEVYFFEGVPETKPPTIKIRHRHENVGRNRNDPWFSIGGWMVVSDEELVRKYSNCISHEVLPR